MRFIVLAAALLAAGTLPAGEKPRRNVVLMIADDLGFQLGCYGDAAIKSPHIDAFARSGTRFTHAFASVSSCSPSRATILTGMPTHQCGQYGLAHAVHNAHTFRTAASLPKLLQAGGYRSGVIGKLHVQPADAYPFDVVIGGGRNVVQMAAQARRFIDECGDKPFFLVMGYTDPHRAAKGFGNDVPVPGAPHERYDPAALKLPYHLPDTAASRADYADFHTSITRLDHGIGLILKTLQELGRTEDTLAIFLSDNGIPFPGAKTTLYDAGLHLPLIIQAPGRRPTACDAMASFTDIAPTVLDWAQLPIPATMPGRSLLPVLEEEKTSDWDAVYGSHQFHEITMYYPMRMVRTRTHKYILNLAHQLPFPFASDLHASAMWQEILKRGDTMMGSRTVAQFVQRPREELYDLGSDPHELKNLAGADSEVLQEMRGKLAAWRKRTNDPWLIKDQHE